MKFLTVKDVSEILQVKESTLYAWAKKGLIPSCKLNGLLRFDVNEIEAWIKQSRNAPYSEDTKKRKPKNQDVDRIIKNAVETVKGTRYTSPKGKTRPVKPGKEAVTNGTF